MDVDISRGRNYVLQTKQKFPILDEAADVFRGLLPFIPTQQRLQFKHIFPALETIIEETLQHQLMPKWSLLPKKTLRELRSMNQIAITPCFQYQGSEFHDLQVTVDFALVIPSNKSPLWYDLPKDIDAEKMGNEIKVPLIDSNEIHYYVIQNFNECRLSYGMEETRMLSKYDVNALPLKCIRICKTLRDMVSTHDFDIASETVTPVIPSYWLKTIALILFELNKNTETERDSNADPAQDLNKDLGLRESCESSSVGYWVFNIFIALYNCLSGYEDTQKPCLSSYNVPFKNLLFGRSEEDDDAANILCDDQKERLLSKNSNALADTKVLLEILTKFDKKEAEARKKFFAVKYRTNKKNKEIYKQGMRDKMGLLLYDYFSSLVEKEPTSEETQAYMDFILKNFPNITIISREDFKPINHTGRETAVNITLVEEGVEIDLEKVFDRAARLRVYYSIKKDDYLTEDFQMSTHKFRYSVVKLG